MNNIAIDKLTYSLLEGKNLSPDALFELYTECDTATLMSIGNRVRDYFHPTSDVTWQIDRNVNITNVCISGCKFCNFHCKLHQVDRAYITTIEQYKEKIEGMLALGGDQLLLQGGMHPRLGIEFYENLFSDLKSLYPNVKLHALGAPEVAYLADKANISDRLALERLIVSGLDSLPGAGAEILDNDIRKRLSPAKCSADRWLNVIGEAHKLGLLTTATMMYNHIETPAQRIAHLIKIRDLQDQKPKGSIGFNAFIAWAYQSKGTTLEKEGVLGINNMVDYVRLIAISRIALLNIKNIQASWLSMGVSSAQMALHAGANDMGSIMIEENVVSATSNNKTTMDKDEMERVIRIAGFTPRRRNQAYEIISLGDL